MDNEIKQFTQHVHTVLDGLIGIQTYQGFDTDIALSKLDSAITALRKYIRHYDPQNKLQYHIPKGKIIEIDSAVIEPIVRQAKCQSSWDNPDKNDMGDYDQGFTDGQVEYARQILDSFGIKWTK